MRKFELLFKKIVSKVVAITSEITEKISKMVAIISSKIIENKVKSIIIGSVAVVLIFGITTAIVLGTAHEHSPDTAVVVKLIRATCMNEGSRVEVVRCLDCNKEISRTTKTIEKLSHTPSGWITDTAATCKTEGSKHKECTVCHTTTETGKIAKLTTHVPANPVRENEIDSSYTSVGSYDEVVYCSVCNVELSRKTKEIAAKFHTPANPVRENEVASTCAKVGSYDEVVYCSVCNAELSRELKYIAKKAHTPSGWITDTAATCKTEGSKHKECTVCHTTTETGKIAKLTTHVPANPVRENEVASTCTKVGSYDEVNYCSICNAELSRELKYIAKKAHTPSGWITDTAATCKAEGSKHKECTVCHTTTETGKIAKLTTHVPANPVRENEVASTCTKVGSYDEVIYCSICNAELSKTNKKIELKEHTYIEKNATDAYLASTATYESPAAYYYSCSCGKAGTQTFTVGEALSGYIKYELTNDSSFYIVSGFVGNDTHITVPNLYDGLRVIGIKSGAFSNNKTLKSITLPISIQTIGSYAFYGCTALESIVIPSSVTEIMPYTFSGCTALKTITLHSKIEAIGQFAFQKCTGLDEVTLNEGLKIISNNAFDGCTALKSISLPDSVTTLGNMAFRHAESLETFNFSKGLKSIGNAAFQYCVKLKIVEIPENITEIGYSAFSFCDGMTTLKILGDITSWGDSAFYECRNIENIYIACSLDGDMGSQNYIFYNAGISSNGIKITISADGVIPERLFEPFENENLPKITAIVIEEGATSVKAFNNYNYLPYLESIEYPSTIIDPCYGVFNNSLWWDNQEIGEVYISDVFYGYKCNCSLATPVIDVAVESTCISTGLTEGYHCSVCDTVIVAQIVTDKKPHDYSCQSTDDEHKASEATCSIQAAYYYSCTCGENGEEIFYAGDTLPHSYTDYNVVKELTESQSGLKERICTVCDYKDTVSIVYCTTCGGDGNETYRKDCPNCYNGTISKSCGYCNGKGKFNVGTTTCGICYGDGYIQDVWGKWQRCLCGGDGEVIEYLSCNICEGSGKLYYDCSNCSDGTLPASRTCVSCDGTGKKEIHNN